jgi:hypothetical protein
MVRIKKQYKQPDGTIIEVEGSESEIEAFEKKQKKQKQQIEETERKKTILYGKDLEEIRKIVREEVAKVSRPIVYEYRYYPHYVQPLYQPGWSIGPAIYGNTCSSNLIATGTVSTCNTDNMKFTLTTTDSPESVTYTAPVGTNVSVYAAQGHGQASSPIASKTTITANSVSKLLGGTGVNFDAGKWNSGGGSSNFLMSPRT